MHSKGGGLLSAANPFQWGMGKCSKTACHRRSGLRPTIDGDRSHRPRIILQHCQTGQQVAACRCSVIATSSGFGSVTFQSTSIVYVPSITAARRSLLMLFDAAMGSIETATNTDSDLDLQALGLCREIFQLGAEQFFSLGYRQNVWLIGRQKESHIHRQRQNISGAPDLIIAQSECLFDVIFFRVSENGRRASCFSLRDLRLDKRCGRECLDFCVQGGFQGGSQPRLPFVYRGLKINDQRLRGTLSRRHKCAKRGECGAPSGGFHHTLHHSIALVKRSPNSRANCGMADDHLVLARVQVSV